MPLTKSNTANRSQPSQKHLRLVFTSSPDQFGRVLIRMINFAFWLLKSWGFLFFWFSSIHLPVPLFLAQWCNAKGGVTDGEMTNWLIRDSCSHVFKPSFSLTPAAFLVKQSSSPCCNKQPHTMRKSRKCVWACIVSVPRRRKTTREERKSNYEYKWSRGKIQCICFVGLALIKAFIRLKESC